MADANDEARLALLHDIDAGKVYDSAESPPWLELEDGDVADVEAAVWGFYGEHLVDSGEWLPIAETEYDAPVRRWSLTDAGRAVLDEAGDPE